MPRKQGRPSRGQESVDRESLLTVAAGLFLNRGYQAVSLDMIAQVAGVDKKSLYYHFDSKGRLFGEAVSLFLRARRQVLEQVLQEPGPVRRRLEDVAHRALRVGPQIHWYRLMVREAGRDVTSSELVPVQRERAAIHDALAHAIRRAAAAREISDAVDPDLAAEVFLL